MEHLIADSGIQFIIREIEFNPNEPLLLPGGKTLKYAFCEAVDFLDGTKTFDLLYHHTDEGKYIPLNELIASPEVLVRNTTGREMIDASGMVAMDPKTSTTLFSTYKDGDDEIYTINSLQSFRVKSPEDGRTQVPAYTLLLDKWLPMPMFRKEIDGLSSDTPLGWCRMKIHRIGDGAKKGMERFRLVWAFDTTTSEDGLSVFRPYIDNDSEQFGLCNMVGQLIGFMASSGDFHAFADYIASLLGIPNDEESCRYKAFYIYFLNFIRLSGGAPDVTLHSGKRDVFVDLVLDIGNSRTCGVLFEEGDFTRSKMLELRDLSMPWITYENRSFDMRIVFRKADFGNDIVLDEDMFQWQSFVRIGEEARRLIYRSLEEEGLAEKTTNYSSPKRYLWDVKPYEGQWENLVTTEDPFNVLLSNDIYVPTLSKHFNADGSFSEEPVSMFSALSQFGDDGTHRYSRSSLMTFALIEIFQHANSQINSIAFRYKWGNKDCRRYIRNVIITCPTAMPLTEQVRLRECAVEAFKAINKCNQKFVIPEIIPSPKPLSITDEYEDPECRVWSYDEASCCQLVYLYAEIGQRYKGEVHKFFELKGHVRPELEEVGYKNKALTVGSIDIGAGTTDVMVCSYKYVGNGQSLITPTPLFWDSFYLAGDDILRNIIQNFVIEGTDNKRPDMGGITSALTARILAMTDDDLRNLPCLDELVYKNNVDNICLTYDVEEKEHKKIAFASNLIHDFFGKDSSMMGYIERRCRIDFNTQISVPIAQLFMDLLRTRRPAKLFSFDELFPEIKPAEYLLDHFEHHFGFRFEELVWRFEPSEVNDVVKATMEPLLKQLALVLYTQHCDIIVLAGRPTSLDAITELFIKYVPTSPDRLVRLNDYQVGSWFATADGQGYFYDQKSIVAVGGMVGYMASHTGLRGLGIDFSEMIRKMKSTANYLGEYNSQRRQVPTTILTPQKSTATLNIAVFPAYIGCRQLDSPIYQARPLYAIYNNSNRNALRVTLSRSFHDNRELLTIEEVCDSEGNTLPKNSVELVPQSLVDGKYWLDNGEFELTVRV